MTSFIQTVNQPVTLQLKGKHFQCLTVNSRLILIGYSYS
jgi:hypothetical protein